MGAGAQPLCPAAAMLLLGSECKVKHPSPGSPLGHCLCQHCFTPGTLQAWCPWGTGAGLLGLHREQALALNPSPGPCRAPPSALTLVPQQPRAPPSLCPQGSGHQPVSRCHLCSCWGGI